MRTHFKLKSFVFCSLSPVIRNYILEGMCWSQLSESFIVHIPMGLSTTFWLFQECHTPACCCSVISLKIKPNLKEEFHSLLICIPFFDGSKNREHNQGHELSQKVISLFRDIPLFFRSLMPLERCVEHNVQCVGLFELFEMINNFFLECCFDWRWWHGCSCRNQSLEEFSCLAGLEGGEGGKEQINSLSLLLTSLPFADRRTYTVWVSIEGMASVVFNHNFERLNP